MLLKDLIQEKQGRSTTISAKSETCPTEEQETLGRWTYFCSKLSRHERGGHDALRGGLQLILREDLFVSHSLLQKHWKGLIIARTCRVQPIALPKLQYLTIISLIILAKLCWKSSYTGGNPKHEQLVAHIYTK